MTSEKRVERFIKKFKSRRQDGLARKIIRLILDGLDVDEFKARARRDHDFIVSALERVLEDSRGLAPNTVRFRLYIAKKFIRFLGVRVDDGLLREQLDIPRKEAVKQDRAPTLEELKLILANSTPRNRVLFHLIAACGLRISEALRIRIGDLLLNEDPPLLRVKSAKSKKFRLIPLTRELVEVLKIYLKNRWGKAEADELLFPSNHNVRKMIPVTDVQQYFTATLRKVGLLKKDSSGKGYEIHLHSLRKFYKTRLESAGVNPLMIERWMGHNLGSVAQAYYRPSREEFIEEWRKAERALTIFTASKETLEEYQKLEERMEKLEKAIKRIVDLHELSSSLKFKL